MRVAKRILIVFAKTPIPGQVKTRIGIEIGMNEAAIIYQEMLEKILVESASNEIWKQVVAITLESDENYFRSKQLDLLRQWGEGIGERMSNMLAQGFEDDADQVMIIGSDCPTLDHAELTEAFLLLDRVPAVIGPSEDGGFYLFGVTREYCQTAIRILRERIAWSTPQVFSEMQTYCDKYALPLTCVVTKRDIDTYTDWLLYLAMQTE